MSKFLGYSLDLVVANGATTDGSSVIKKHLIAQKDISILLDIVCNSNWEAQSQLSYAEIDLNF